MKHRTRRTLGACGLAAALTFSLTGCASQHATQNDGATAQESHQDNAQNDTNGNTSELDLEFTKRDLDASYDKASATKITLADAGINVQGDGATTNGSAVTLSVEGTYILSGALSNGRIIVDAGDEDKLQLVFDGISVTNATGPALCVENADKCFITLAEGSSNALADGEAYQFEGEDDNRDATVFSRDDLTINGTGELSVTGAYKHGICSNDDLVITGGVLNVTSQEDALRGKDCIKIADGSFTVNAGDDAFHSDAYFYAKGGTIKVEACYEGYEGEQVIIDGGEHTIVAEDDALNAALSDSDSTETASPNGTRPEGGQGFSVEDGASSADGGASSASAPPNDRETPPADLGAPPDEPGVSPGGANGERPSAPGGNGDRGEAPSDALAPAAGGGQMAQSSDTCLIQINGGKLSLTAGNDGIDSNGNVEINGGTVLVAGPDAGMDGSLDYDLSASVNGGTVLMVGSVGNTKGLDASAQSVTYASVQGSAGQEVALLDADGAVLATLVAPAGFAHVLASAPSIQTGASFTVSVDGTSSALTAGSGLDMAQNGARGQGSAGMRGVATA